MGLNRQIVDVGGQRLTVTNLDKVLYPDSGFTKGQVLDYYARIAPVLLPHIAARPVTRKRYPDGVAGPSFFEKNAPRGTPDWVRTVRLPSPGSTKNRDEIDYVVADDLATLIWLGNLAALELHVPQWTVGPRGDVRGADLLVLDLDPGKPATIVECCEVAALLRDALAAGGLACYAKTSGSKGMQVYAPIAPAAPGQTRSFARALAQEFTGRQPDLILSTMTRAIRTGKVLIDWSQNTEAKTTIAPYSLRARSAPTVSTPVTWEEVAACRRPDDLRFTSDDALARVDEHGDLFAPLLTADRPPLPDVPHG